MPPFKFGGAGPLDPFGFRLFSLFAGKDLQGDEDFDEQLSPEWTYLRAIVNNPGRPLYMVPPEMYVYDAGLGW